MIIGKGRMLIVQIIVIHVNVESVFFQAKESELLFVYC